MHHVHISSTALFVVGFFVAAIVITIAAAIVSIKRDRRRAEALARQPVVFPQHNAMTRDGHWPAAPDTFSGVRTGGVSAPLYTATVPPLPAYTPVGVPVGYGMDPGLAMVEGMLIGEALSSHHHDHTTVINEGPTFVDSSPSYTPSYDSGITFDSGPSFSDSSSSGGIDISW